MKTKAAILEKLNAPLVIDELEIPTLECGQILVKVHASGICGKQIGEINGIYGEDKYLPHLLGHEGGGIVIAVGPGVTQVKPSNHVVMHWRKGVGIEADFPRYKSSNELIGAGKITTFNEFAVVSENRLTRIDENIPFEIAALMGCAVTTGLGVVFNDAQLKPGQSIAVIGCGGVGLNVIQGATMVSAYAIAAVDIYDSKLRMAEMFGANGFINIKDDPGGIVFIEDFDVIVDTTGQFDLIAKAYELVAPGGKVIMVGQATKGKPLVIPDMSKNFTGKTLTDSQGGQTNPSIDIPRYLELYRRRILKLDDLITHRYPLDKVNEAIEMTKSGKAGRCIIEM